MPPTSATSCFGYCAHCDVVHTLGSGNAKTHARALMAELSGASSADYAVSPPKHDSLDTTADVIRGQMFGILECVDTSGETVILRAFSALLEGMRQVDGWVPPILTEADHKSLVLPEEQRIKSITTALQKLQPEDPTRQNLILERKTASQHLFAEIQNRYRFHNFRGQSASLRDAFILPKGIPGGVGDCCAPKLLNFAATHDLRPVGIAEFYWGATNPSETRIHGEFYPCCESKCQPILGFMLCGLEVHTE